MHTHEYNEIAAWHEHLDRLDEQAQIEAEEAEALHYYDTYVCVGKETEIRNVA